MFWPSHPAADLFPMLGKDELAALRQDIETNGLHEPLRVWQGHLIDGRNRREAIKGTMVTPKIQEMDFKSESEAIAYIISTNLKRRHLTESQRSMIATELAKLEQGTRQVESNAQICASGPALTQQQAADSLNVSRRAVQQAKAVAKASPELAAKVKAGEISLNKAYQMIKGDKPKKPPKPKAPPRDQPSHNVTAEVTPKPAPLYCSEDASVEDLPPDLPGDVGGPAPKKPAPVDDEDDGEFEDDPYDVWEASDERKALEKLAQQIYDLVDKAGAHMFVRGWDGDQCVALQMKHRTKDEGWYSAIEYEALISIR